MMPGGAQRAQDATTGSPWVPLTAAKQSAQQEHVGGGGEERREEPTSRGPPSRESLLGSRCHLEAGRRREGRWTCRSLGGALTGGQQ